MDELRNRLQVIVRHISLWIDFGVLVILVALVLPFAVAFFIALMLLPIGYLVFAVQQTFWYALYLLTVFGACAAYMIWNSNRDDNDGYTRGRRVISERRARERARVRLRRSTPPRSFRERQ